MKKISTTIIGKTWMHLLQHWFYLVHCEILQFSLREDTGSAGHKLNPLHKHDNDLISMQLKKLIKIEQKKGQNKNLFHIGLFIKTYMLKFLPPAQENDVSCLIE
jgi:hypothetical protein